RTATGVTATTARGGIAASPHAAGRGPPSGSGACGEVLGGALGAHGADGDAGAVGEWPLWRFGGATEGACGRGCASGGAGSACAGWVERQVASEFLLDRGDVDA